ICSLLGSKATRTDDGDSVFRMSCFLRAPDFFPLTDVDLATAFVFPTLADAASALLFFATIKFLPKLRFSEGLRVDKRFPNCAWRTHGFLIKLRHAAFCFSLVRDGVCGVCGSARSEEDTSQLQSPPTRACPLLPDT